MSSFSINKIRIGSAVTAQDMPTPRMNCSRVACGPIQPGNINKPAATTLPKISGIPSAIPAVMPLSQRFAHAVRKSSSTPAINTKIITAHQPMPLRAWMTPGVKTKV
jgi:hypothetical protein